MPKIEIKNNSKVAIHGLRAGATMKIDVDSKGNPLSILWRHRFRDSKIDGAITIVDDKPLEAEAYYDD